MTLRLNIGLILILAFLMVFQTLRADDSRSRKKRVCTITLNSEKEKDSFVSHLTSGKNKDNFEFQELVDSNNKNWFQAACDRGTECDVVLVSGHFSEVFFGDDPDGPELDLGEVEESACLDRNSPKMGCKGITQNPTEVFFFGCNTLAGRSPDSRSPEQYHKHLSEYYKSDFADEVTEQRYGQVGVTYRSRMEMAFEQVPHLYGFDSVSPLGRVLSPRIDKYLENPDVEDYSAHLDRLNAQKINSILEESTQKINASTLTPRPVCENRALSQAMQGTNFIECNGRDYLAQDEYRKDFQKNYCELVKGVYLGKADNSKTYRLNALEALEQVMNQSDFLKYFVKAKDFVETGIKNPESGPLTPEEAAVWKRLKKNQIAKKRVLDYLKKAKWPEIKKQLNDFALAMEWIKPAQKKSKKKK